MIGYDKIRNTGLLTTTPVKKNLSAVGTMSKPATFDDLAITSRV